jgi:hypothetical protein
MFGLRRSPSDSGNRRPQKSGTCARCGPQAGEGFLPLLAPRLFFGFTFPSPPGRGWTAAGVFTSRSGPGEGFPAPVSLRHSPQKPSRCGKKRPINDAGECRGTYEGAANPHGSSCSFCEGAGRHRSSLVTAHAFPPPQISPRRPQSPQRGSGETRDGSQEKGGIRVASAF